MSVPVFYYVEFIISWMKVFSEPMFWEKLLQLSWKANSNLLITTAYYLNSISSDHDSTQKNTLHNLFCILTAQVTAEQKKSNVHKTKCNDYQAGFGEFRHSLKSWMNIYNVRYLINCDIKKNDIAKQCWNWDNSFKSDS